jgi:hypothetical protein
LKTIGFPDIQFNHYYRVGEQALFKIQAPRKIDALAGRMSRASATSKGENEGCNNLETESHGDRRQFSVDEVQERREEQHFVNIRCLEDMISISVRYRSV